jgi:hypothetical protein
MTTAAIAFGGSAVNYGCDASGTNDNLATINAALVALTGTGGVLYFGAGTFNVSAAITNTGSVPILIGTGATFTGSGASSITGVALAWPYSASGGFTAGADIAGTAIHQYVVNISGGSTPGTVTITSPTLAFQQASTIEATSGASSAITFKNADASNVLNVQNTNTSSTSGISFLDASGALQAVMGYYHAGLEFRFNGYGNGSGIPINLYFNSVLKESLGASNSDFIALGSAPAATGHIRMSNLNTDFNAVMKVRNAANSADLAIVRMDSANELTWGDFGNSANIFQTSTAFYWQIASVNTANLDAAALSLNTGVSLIGTGVFIIDSVGGSPLQKIELGPSCSVIVVGSATVTGDVDFGVVTGGSIYGACGSPLQTLFDFSLVGGTGTQPALWFDNHPSSSNYSLSYDGTYTYLNGPALQFQVAASVYAQMSSTVFGFGAKIGGIPALNALAWAHTSVSLSAGTVNTLTATQFANPIIALSVTASSGVTTVVFPNVDTWWILDLRNVNITSTATLVIEATTATKTIAIAAASGDTYRFMMNDGAGSLYSVKLI